MAEEKPNVEAQKAQMKLLFAKARAARKEGKRELAYSFRNGAQRLQRHIKAVTPYVPKKKEE
jgi:hypothetical protein